jgi:hypothetical protein
MGKYFRVTYGMQAIAALNVLIAIFLPWHTEFGSATDLLARPLEDFQFPLSFFNVWWLMWLLPPIVLLSILRGLSGMFNYEVPFRRASLVLSGVASLSMAWFYINFGDNNPTGFRQTFGEIQFGYWLTLSSLVLLILLIVVESNLPEQDPKLLRISRLAPDDPERLWEGHYRSCTYCGSPNDPSAKRCSYCGITLFPEKI